tara:strand:- start:1355 stop:1678 length:324 start_codon:yes stop_codon:yes gene_type:complete
MIKVIKKESADGCTNGTYKVGSLTEISYWDLKKAFGEPTYSTPSGDDKVQKEWVFEFEDKNFTIYDWKTYDERYTVEELRTWSIGGKSSSIDFETAVLKRTTSFLEI